MEGIAAGGLFEQAAVQTHAIVIITDRRGRIVFVNPAFTRVSGYSFEEVRGRSVSILKSGQMNHRVYEELWTRIREGKEWVGDFVNRAKDGSIFHERASIAPVTNAEGMITHYVSVQEDITEHECTMAELRRSRERLQSILERHSYFVVRIDEEGRYSYANGAYLRTFGYEHSGIVGVSVEESICEDDVSAVLDAGERALAHPGHAVSLSMRKPMPTGGYRWTEWDFVAVPEDEAGSREIQAIGRFVADEDGARAASRARERELLDLVNSMYDMVIVLDEDFRILEVNTAALPYLRQSRRDLRNKSIFDAVDAVDLGHFALAMHEVDARDEAFVSVDVRSRDGETARLELVCRRARLGDREVTLCSGRPRPNAGRRTGGAAVADNEAVSDHAEAGGSEAGPADLAERQDELLAGVARVIRDLRQNPERYDRAERNAVLASLEAAVGSSRSHIRNYAIRNERDRIFGASCPQLLPVRRIVEYGLGPVRSFAAGKDVAVDLTGTSDLNVRVDREALGDIIRNLGMNAVKFSPSAGRVELAWHSSGGDLVVGVRDYGTGMSAEALQHIRGRRAPAFRPGTEGERGLGLGLRVVFQAAKRLGAEIDFSAPPDGGTHVRVIVPQAIADQM